MGNLFASLWQVDLLRVLVNEKLPGKDHETGEDLSKRAAAARVTSYFYILL